jgi:hypothetical protein
VCSDNVKEVNQFIVQYFWIVVRDLASAKKIFEANRGRLRSLCIANCGVNRLLILQVRCWYLTDGWTRKFELGASEIFPVTGAHSTESTLKSEWYDTGTFKNIISYLLLQSDSGLNARSQGNSLAMFFCVPFGDNAYKQIFARFLKKQNR